MHRLNLSIRFTLLLAVLLNIFVSQPASAVSCGHSKSHNAFFGLRRPGDQLVHSEHVKVGSKLLRTVPYDFVFPSSRDPPANITRIEFYDQFVNGHGGCASILSGGVGSSHAIIHLESQRGYGLDFIIYIFGKRLWRY